MTYEATWDSVATHRIPQWFDDAKLGVFIHWGLYSIPGWAPQVENIQALLHSEGPAGMLRNNPYAEWYRNTMQISQSPTWQHHRETYGPDFGYDDFIPEFNAGAEEADLDAIANLCHQAGAKYVVLTTKHHEGFTLWPATTPHPIKGKYAAQRDLVADMTTAITEQGMQMGLYYSGGYDWPFNDAVMSKAADAMLAVPAGRDYLEYATAHVQELIHKYRPSVLWNDVCWPGGGNLAGIFADYYNTVPEGVVNDRWLEPTAPRGPVRDAITRSAGDVMQALWQHLPEDSKSLTFPAAHHYDFSTPEYATFDKIPDKKWEATRGVGHSFGANRNERPEDIVTTTALVRLLCDVVAKNGNLLIGIGPDQYGRIPPEQQAPLRGLGDWMAANGEAIHGTRPYALHATTTSEGTPVRFSQGRSGDVFALLTEAPGRSTFGIRGLKPTTGSAQLMGTDVAVPLSDFSGMLGVTLPDRVPVSPALVVNLGGQIEPAQPTEG